MTAEQPGRPFGLTVLGGPEHRPVLGRLVLPARGLRVIGLAPPGGRADQGGLVAQVVEHLFQERVPAAGVELAVEVAVGQAAFGLIRGVVGAVEGLVCVLPVVAPGYRAGQRLGLEQQTGVVYVPGQLVVHHADGGTFVRVHDHKPGAGQGLERLAHRGLGHAEHFGQVGLDQRLPGPELAGQDRVLDRLEHGDRPRRERARRPGQEQGRCPQGCCLRGIRPTRGGWERWDVGGRHHVSHLIYDRISSLGRGILGVNRAALASEVPRRSRPGPAPASRGHHARTGGQDRISTCTSVTSATLAPSGPQLEAAPLGLRRAGPDRGSDFP